MSCDECVWKNECIAEAQEFCKNNNYILRASKEDKELCDLMCGDIEND